MTTPKNEQVTTSIDNWEFRKTLGLFATGVTVVAVEVDGEIFGMTANAVTSVSLEPPLVLVCVDKQAHLMAALQKSDQFSINILSEGQADLSSFFANMWPEPEPPDFTFIPWTGVPCLAGTLGAIACRIHEFLEGGDHWIIVGQIIDLYREEDPANPLLYYRGQYRQILDR